MTNDAGLSTGLVQSWIADASDAVGRLMGAGIAHPDPELPETFGLLAERATALGAETATGHLERLEESTAALRPGPPDLTSRIRLAGVVWDESMRFLAWLRLFRSDIDVHAAAARALGESAESTARDDLPRYTDRVYVDGLTLSAERRLVIVGHDDQGRSVLAFDPLASGNPKDPFAEAVISRLFQEQLWLGDLAGCALDFEGHPFARRGNTILLQPAFRAVPRRMASDHPLGGAGSELFDADIRVVDGSVRVRARDGRPVQVGRTFAFNVWKRLASVGRSEATLSLVGLPRREGRLVIAAVTDQGPTFPSMDARCWRLHPERLATVSRSASLWLRAAIAMFGGLDGPDRERLFAEVAASTARGVDGWRLAWWAARVGARAPQWTAEPGDPPEEGFAAVWAALWEGSTGSLHGLWESRYEALREPSLPDVCARALLMDALQDDREAAVAYLTAHLTHLQRTGAAAPVLPSSLHLLFLADTRAWLTEGDRSGPVGSALALPVEPLRERLARRLFEWRVHGEEGDLGDAVALGAISAWGATVVG